MRFIITYYCSRFDLEKACHQIVVSYHFWFTDGPFRIIYLSTIPGQYNYIWLPGCPASSYSRESDMIAQKLHRKDSSFSPERMQNLTVFLRGRQWLNTFGSNRGRVRTWWTWWYDHVISSFSGLLLSEVILRCLDDSSRISIIYSILHISITYLLYSHLSFIIALQSW